MLDQCPTFSINNQVDMAALITPQSLRNRHGEYLYITMVKVYDVRQPMSFNQYGC